MKKLNKWLVAVLTVAALGAFGVGAALANSSSRDTNTPLAAPPSHESQQEISEIFLTNLATTLGVDEDTLTAALKTAATATVNQEVADGVITQEQAERILANFEKDGASFFRIDIGHGPGHGGPGGSGGDKQPPSDITSDTTN